MKILIDVGHPAHVHLFKHVARELAALGHDILFTARDKEMTVPLLRHEQFPFVSFGKPYRTVIGKLWGWLKFDLCLLRVALRFCPDIYLSHGSFYAAQVAWLLGKPHIAMEDTGNMEQIRLYLPFSKAVLTSTVFHRQLGPKQIPYDGCHELAYLHPRRFRPDPAVFQEVGLKENEPFVILRFVSWHASHDRRQRGFSVEQQAALIREMARRARVFISAEGELPQELAAYRLQIAPQRMHHLLAYAALYVGEGATMASECAMLGTPAIYLNSQEISYCQFEERAYRLVFNFRTFVGVIDKAIELLAKPDRRMVFLERRRLMLADMIDVTAFVTWFIVDFPQSYQVMKKNPRHQRRFIAPATTKPAPWGECFPRLIPGSVKVISVVGARPNFMKVAPIHRAMQPFRECGVTHLICHTGQHYDEKMSKVFFRDLELPQPDFYLGVSSGSHAEQTARIMVEFEKVLLREKPQLVIVVGDVNSTLAGSLTAVKLGFLVAHVEAGLRSFDRTMPEEINRLLTDSISDFLFVTEESGIVNLRNEGVASEKIHFSGNVMIDSLVHYLAQTDGSTILPDLGVEAGRYLLMTFHRPNNVDTLEALSRLVNFLNRLATERPIVFPIHPRTSENMKRYGLIDCISPAIKLCEPLGYIDFLALTRHAELIITDSGGIQEESTYLNVPCITVRNSTERPVTVDQGTNHLVGANFDQAEAVAWQILGGDRKTGQVPPLWDGRAAERIVAVLVDRLLPGAGS
jgi:UDP-N-acetylglucosamine 2-epimerase (non-hydrolysing)